MNIRSSSDLRLAYELLTIFKDAGKAYSVKADEMKRQIRSYNSLQYSSRIVCDDGIDGYVELIQVPYCFDSFSKEEVENWFDDNCTYGPIHSAYDCTGRPFTSWFKVFRRQGHWFVYHSVGFDV